jgi:YD repeat-containing protein
MAPLTDVAKNGFPDEHFEYDNNGNRLATRMTGGQTTTYTYDAFGNRRNSGRRGRL